MSLVSIYYFTILVLGNSFNFFFALRPAPRTDLAASPADTAAITTDATAEGEATILRASDDLTEATRLCRHCCVEPIESPSTSQTTPQKHHQAGVEKPLVRPPHLITSLIARYLFGY